MHNSRNPKYKLWEIWISPEELFYRYIKQRWSIHKMAKYYKCSTIHHKLKSFKIPRRSTTEVLIGRKLPEYHCENIAKAQIGSKHSETTKLKMKNSALKIPPEIRKKMHEKLVETIAGSKHWNWNGGIKQYRYESNYYDYIKCRQLVLDRDSRECALCGSKKDLEVHHVYPFQDYPLLGICISNGITLCRDCHQKKVNQHEYEYIPIFIKILEAEQ